MMDTPELAGAFVAAMNASEQATADDPDQDPGGSYQGSWEHATGHGAGW